jgi:hypothetical protein
LLSPLLGLLGHGSAVDVLVDIGSGVELTSTTLDTVPDLSCGRRSALGTDEVIDTGLEHGERVLDVAALRESGAQECSVDGNQDPRAALEENSREQQADPKEDLEAGHDRHGHVVVLLNEGANSVRKRVSTVRRLRVRRAGGGDDLGGDDGGDQVGASVGRDVEDRVDAVGQQSERVLGHEEPDQSHDCFCLVSDIRHASAPGRLHTQILNVLVGEVANGASGLLSASLLASPPCLVDHDTVRQGSRDKCQPVRDLSHAGVVVHADP